jgi:excinuclease ABC subunit A
LAKKAKQAETKVAETPKPSHSGGCIELEGVRVHNLRGFDLKIRHHALTAICGVSGSGKSSLAFDTLYAEGQRRYIETFSPSARQFLDRIERPAVDRISGLPPAIAIRQQQRQDGLRSTLGTRTEIIDYLRVLFARAGDTVCPDCNLIVRPMNAESAAEMVLNESDGRLMIVCEFVVSDDATSSIDQLIRSGFTRAIHDGRTVRLEEMNRGKSVATVTVIVDRLKSDPAICPRLAETITTAMNLGSGRCSVLAERWKEPTNAPRASSDSEVPPISWTVDEIAWHVVAVSRHRECRCCGRMFPEPTPEQLSFTSALGACEVCEGAGVARQTGRVAKGRQAATPSSEAQAQICPSCHGTRLKPDALAIRLEGKSLIEVAAMECGDVLEWLERLIHSDRSSMATSMLCSSLRPAFDQAMRRLKMLMDLGLGYLSLNRAMSTLSGGEAQRAALTAALGSGLINTLYVLDEPTAGLHANDTQKVFEKIRELQQRGNTVVIVEHDPAIVLAADEVIEIGPGAGVQGGMLMFQGAPDELLTADTTTGLRFRQHVNTAASALPSSAKLAEPSEPAKGTAKRRRKNDSTETSMSASEQASFDDTFFARPVVRRAGDVSPLINPLPYHQGIDIPRSPETCIQLARSTTPARPPQQWLELNGVECHNIHGLDVRIPLGVFCAVVGVSGSGKSSLIADALYPELCRILNVPCQRGSQGSIATIDGANHLENVLLLEQSPIPRSRRSIPATWIGVFDDIRVLLSETHEAKKRNFSRAMFSFNAASGGRCPVCEGRGIVTVAMQFLADIETPCEECHGQRFRPDVLDVRYRDRSVDDILNMTADDAFVFFNGHHRIQQRLNAMRQSGLGYIRLGQPLSTISGGEAQRLRIAALLAGLPLSDGDTAAENRKTPTLTRAGRTLFLLDEPSAGLHLQDVDHFVTCIDFLVQTGHSVVVIDHDDALISRADWIIELGPGPGKLGGKVVSTGGR